MIQIHQSNFKYYMIPPPGGIVCFCHWISMNRLFISPGLLGAMMLSWDDETVYLIDHKVLVNVLGLHMAEESAPHMAHTVVPHMPAISSVNSWRIFLIIVIHCISLINYQLALAELMICWQ